ncbi:HlyD family secretion protein [Pseudomonas syringae]|uniref:HlyD family secretion protein n=1 Tax=Pseudomonas syringae TaxID=317 RepID=UPI003F87F9F6
MKKIVAIAMAFSLCLLILLGKYTETAAATGVVEPAGGYVSITTSQSGNVVNLLVQEGAEVILGAPLAEIISQRLDAYGHDVGRAIVEKLQREKEIITTKIHQLEGRTTGKKYLIEVRLARAEGQLASARSTFKYLSATLGEVGKVTDQYRQLEREGFVSQDMLAEKSTGLASLQATLFGIQKQVDDLQDRVLSLREEISDLEQASANEKLSLQIELEKTGRELDVASIENHSWVNASIAGRVVAVSVQQGQAVERGESLFMLTPPGSDLYIRLDVPAEAMARLKVGQLVKLRYAAFPFQKYGTQGGVITSISGGPVKGSSVGSEKAVTHGDYRVLVRPDTQTIRDGDLDLNIPLGTKVDANIEISDEWILGWVYSILLRNS